MMCCNGKRRTDHHFYECVVDEIVKIHFKYFTFSSDDGNGGRINTMNGFGWANQKEKEKKNKLKL